MSKIDTSPESPAIIRGSCAAVTAIQLTLHEAGEPVLTKKQSEFIRQVIAGMLSGFATSKLAMISKLSPNQPEGF